MVLAVKKLMQAKDGVGGGEEDCIVAGSRFSKSALKQEYSSSFL